MNWVPLIVGTIGALVATFVVLKSSGRLATKLSYDELKKDRDFSLFMFAFMAFWMTMVSWRIDYSGLNFGAGVLIAVCLVIVYRLARTVHNVATRPKVSTVRVENKR